MHRIGKGKGPAMLGLNERESENRSFSTIARIGASENPRFGLANSGEAERASTGRDINTAFGIFYLGMFGVVPIAPPDRLAEGTEIWPEAMDIAVSFAPAWPATPKERGCGD
jgi:hypothetical protein